MPTPITLTFPVCINMESGDVELFGQDVTSSEKRVLCDLSMNFMDISGMFTYVQKSSDPNDVTVNPTAGFDYSNFEVSMLNCISKSVTVDATGGYSWWPNAQDSRKTDPTSSLFHYDNIFQFILATVAYKMFSHPLAQAAIDNDTMITTNVLNSNIQGNLISAIQALTNEQCKAIFQQILKQDPSRFSLDDINSTEQPISHPIASPQTLKFLPGDKIQFELHVNGYRVFTDYHPSFPSAGTMYPDMSSSWQQLTTETDQYYTLIISLDTEANIYAANKKVFNFRDGTLQNFVVPAGVSSVHVELWGAGGGGGRYANLGGAGAYVAGDLAVTPGETLGIIVGKGGSDGGSAQTNTEGGGGGSTYYNAELRCGSGGGRSAIQRSGDDIVTAGGGGGGCYNGNSWAGWPVAITLPWYVSKYATYMCNGGPARWNQQSYGGFSRIIGEYVPSAGASSTAAGEWNVNGSKYFGATALESGGGGGGYYGGASRDRDGGGGGGSSFIDNLTNATGADGFGPFAPITSSPNQQFGISSGNGFKGGNGMVVITWT